MKSSQGGSGVELTILFFIINATDKQLCIFQVLEACVKNCGKRFHQEIGKFRFLNEIIKVVSPKVSK